MLEIEQSKPYPYPQDIRGLFARWSKRSGYQVPSTVPYQEQLFQAVNTVFLTTDLITEEEMLATAKLVLNKCRKEGFACISIDDVYMPQLIGGNNILNYLDVTRLVDESLRPAGLGQRNRASGELDYQLQKLAKSIGNKPTVIYDDVAWQGSTMATVIDNARLADINIKEVVVAIGIGEALKVVERKGLPCKATYYYPDVIDTVSERDFMVGAPSSGRTIQTNEGQMGAPYVEPLGNASDWASIPKENVYDFSIWVLNIAREFWSKAETLSQTSIPTQALDKPPLLLPVCNSVVFAINQIIQKSVK